MAADIFTNLLGSLGMDFTHPITLAINLILSTIIGGIVLLIIVEIIGKKFKENVHPMNAFLVVLIINIINMPFIIGLIMPIIGNIPFVGILLPVFVWIVLIKIFFREMKFSHAILVGIIGFILSIFIIPHLVAMAMGLIPSFG